ncbi:hypothetical protein PAAG_04310 [Paracoccidioides lutzii Pb01]|uniref:Telomeric single stranded DNA binding POT1/Cdc13 domain-containing protein n=1 Tax=Paracoccidioides lutzii (strain ATCC MYA-826 / Pb01) TaxID=502779 RepID=C1H0L6_PARBA|nr:hypothetical protein PAAG_04310 [Paracoccidioides lutzii Pb01]EEH33257.2 hypothetical protein PAAG_04310 [Paracoccidioides lutzii Pb01]
MELPIPADGEATLASPIPTPLAQLSPSLENLRERHIRAVVILLWPYSSLRKQFSFILSEPDFRLRDKNGQVKISFRDASAEAVAKSDIGIGDTVVLSLYGAKWLECKAEIGSPGKCIDWDLAFSNRLLLEIYRDSKLFKTVEVEVPRNENLHVDGELPKTQNLPPSTPKLLTDGEPDRPSTTGSWSAPAFSQNLRASLGSLSNSACDPLAEEDGYIWGKGRKRTKFGRPSSEWVFVDTSPSPPPATTDALEDEDYDFEEDQQDITMEDFPSQTDTIHLSQATTFLDGEAQDGKTVRDSKPPKLAVQTESMHTVPPPKDPRISAPFNPIFDNSQTDALSSTFTHASDWDASQSQQPTVTPYSSFADSFERPLFNHEDVSTPRQRPILSPEISIVSSLETTLAGPNISLPASRSPLSNQLYSENITGAELVGQAPIVESTVDKFVNGVGYNGDHLLHESCDRHYMPEQRTNNGESLLSPTSADLDKHRPPKNVFRAEEDYEQEQLYGDTSRTHVMAPPTTEEKREIDGTEVEHAGLHPLPQTSQKFPQHVYEADQEMTDIDADSQKENDINSEGALHEVPARSSKEDMVGAQEEFYEWTGGIPNEDLEEELEELEEELEERLEEEEYEKELEEDRELNSDDDMEHIASEASSQYDSESLSDESSEFESEEDALPPRAVYLSAPRPPPEIIVLDSDEEDEAGSYSPMAPPYEEFLGSDISQAPGTSETTVLHPQTVTTSSFGPPVKLNGTSQLEMSADGPETGVLVEEELNLSLQAASFADVEPTSRLNEPLQQVMMGEMAEAALHMDKESVSADGADEDTFHRKSADLDVYSDASPSFSAELVSGSERESRHESPNQVAIEPQLYRSRGRKSSEMESESQNYVEPGISRDGAVDVDSWHEPKILESTDSKGRLLTAVETQKCAEIQPSPPPSETILTDDDLVASQLFRDMEEQERRKNGQAPDRLNIFGDPAKGETFEISLLTPLPTNNGETPNEAVTIQTPSAESPTILQPNTNATGLRTRLSYFSPLSTLADNFNNMTDTISVVISCSQIGQSTKGPREYYTTLHLTDPSMAGMTVCAQIFRRTKSPLPAVAKGDVILLRDFKVQTIDHSMMLLSMAASSWAVFPAGSDTDVEMNGSPVEYGAEEIRFVSTLREWFLVEGEELAVKHEYLTTARGSTDAGSSVSSMGSGSPSGSRGSIFKKFARQKKPRHRRIAIHELRDGTRYPEVGSPADEVVHELRDGTVYSNL